MSELSSSEKASVVERTRVTLNLIPAEEILASLPTGFLAKATTASELVGYFAELADKPPELFDYLRAGPLDWVFVDGFKVSPQCHTKWCWAAVGEGVARCYNPGTDCTQHSVAKMMLGSDEDFDAPCVDPLMKEEEPSQFNRPEVLRSVLHRLDCYGSEHTVPFVAPPPQNVQQWIDGDQNGRRVVCVRIEWPDQNGHFVAIDGYCRNTDLIHVWDPLGQQAREIAFTDLAKNYEIGPNKGGAWTHTLYTKRGTAVCGNH
jgi:hypothetical protein